MNRRFLSYILALSLLLGLCSPVAGLVPTAEAANRSSGSLSPMGAESIRWVRDETLTLTLSGSGALPDEPTQAGLCPFHSPNDGSDSIHNLKTIILEEGITHIGKGFFQDAWSCTEVSLPTTLTSIGEHAFDGTRDLPEISLGSTASIGAYAFQDSGLQEISIPSSLSYIGPYAFSGCSALDTVYYAGTQAQWETIQIETGNSALTNASIIYMAEEMGPNEEDPLVIPTPVLQTIQNKTDGIAITWNADFYLPGVSLDSLGYHILRKTEGGSYQKIATISDLSTSTYTDTSVKMLETYTYTVRIFAGDEVGSYDSKGLSITHLAVVQDYTNYHYENKDLGWAVLNASKAFGLPDGYTIPSEQFAKVLGFHPLRAAIELCHSDYAGFCFGMALLAAAQYNGQVSLERYFDTSTGPLAEFGISKIVKDSSGYLAALDGPIVSFVEQAFLRQWDPMLETANVYKTAPVVEEQYYGALLRYLKSDNSAPLLVNLWDRDGRGHTVLTYPGISPTQIASGVFRITLYDPNLPQFSPRLSPYADAGSLAGRYLCDTPSYLYVDINSGMWYYYDSYESKEHYKYCNEYFIAAIPFESIRFYDVRKLPDYFFEPAFSIQDACDFLDESSMLLLSANGLKNGDSLSVFTWENTLVASLSMKNGELDVFLHEDYVQSYGAPGDMENTLYLSLSKTCSDLTITGDGFSALFVTGDTLYTASAERSASVTFRSGTATGTAQEKGSLMTAIGQNVRREDPGPAASAETTLAAGDTFTLTLSRDGTAAITGPKDQKYDVVIEEDGERTEKNQVTQDGLAIPNAPFPFTDVTAKDWFYDAVTYVYENSLMSGTSTTTFTPNGTMSRAMLATVLYRMEGEPAVEYPVRQVTFGGYEEGEEVPEGYCYCGDFRDVTPDMWYSDAIMWANQEGIVTGYGGEAFGTNDPVTREQLVTMLFRYAQTKTNTFLFQKYSSYRDANQVSDWASKAMMWAMANDIISGTSSSTLSPKTAATRAQCAAILMRYCEN